ncbi:MAG TPA: hypothetical protein VGY48_09875 [Vicinamibacterales bacterium]|jgi:hypothetical protein|nr:hypothetical protein [Vicinamibacterales bacterium]
MFHTGATVLTQDFTAQPEATQACHALPTDLRLRWTVRDGRLMARWEQERDR